MMSSMGGERPHIKRSIKLRLIVSALILLILALGFNTLLSLNSLEKLYVESLASQYSAIGEDLQRNLEQAIRYGKKIEKFVGMDKILEETKRNLTKEYSNASTTLIQGISESDVSVSVALPDGSILYSTEESLVGTMLPGQIKIKYENTENRNASSLTSSYIKYKNTYFTPLPIRDPTKKWIAIAIIAFDEKQVNALLNTILDSTIKLISLILVCSTILLIVLLQVVTPEEVSFSKFPKLRIALVMLFVIGSAQIGFSGFNTNAFRTYYLQINKQKARTLTRLRKEDIEFLFSKGIQIDKLVKMDVVMGEIINASPELSDMTILNKEHIPLYMATKKGVTDFQKATDDQLKLAYRFMPLVDPGYNIRLELLKGKNIEGYISSNLSKDVIFAKLLEISLDSVTILVISMLFFGELLILIFHLIERDVISMKQAIPVIHYGAIRPVAFLFFFGIDICISFLPLHMATLYKPILGLSKTIVMGLPISIQMFFTGISLLIAGAWSDRRGWYEPFLIGLLLSAGGFYYAWLAPNALHFLVALGLVGLGYGLSYMASQGFIISSTTEATKAQGLAQLYAGCLAGSICGGAAGAMLAQRIGYAPVFLVGSGMLVFVILFTVISMRSAIRKPERHATYKTTQAAKIGPILRFLSNRNVLGVMLLSSFPASVAIVGFLNYFSPVYLKQIGTSQSNIGRILMIYGLCIIYIAPYITKKVGGSRAPQKYIFFSGLLGSLAFVSFHLLGGIAVAVAVAIFLLGLSGSFNAFRNSYAVHLEVSQELGEGTAMGILFSVARLGQVAGPLIFGWLIAVGIDQGITYFGIVYLVVTVLFFLSAQGSKKVPVTEKLSS
jgi:predicted MFS family arabinose efflux permease